MSCALKKFLKKFPDSDLRRLGCIFRLYDVGLREFTSVSLRSAMFLLCNCDGVNLWTIQVFLKRMRDNNIMNMRRMIIRNRGRTKVYELNMQNELVVDLFSKYHAVGRGEIYVNDDVDDGVCKYELSLLRQYWCFTDMIPERRLVRVRRVMENILEKV